MAALRWSLILLSWGVSVGAWAAESAPKPSPVDSTSPVGRWRTWDDETGKAKSIVEIWEEAKGTKLEPQKKVLQGRIITLLDPKPDNPDPKCDKCEGDLKDVRVTGMRILWDLTRDGDEFSGGKVLDPKNGKIYKCTLKLVDGGQKIDLRGYVGFSLLGRTQHWTREP
jgi:uncharacterized protein (DUF2147 family)